MLSNVKVILSNVKATFSKVMAMLWFYGSATLGKHSGNVKGTFRQC